MVVFLGSFSGNLGLLDELFPRLFLRLIDTNVDSSAVCAWSRFRFDSDGTVGDDTVGGVSDGNDGGRSVFSKLVPVSMEVVIVGLIAAAAAKSLFPCVKKSGAGLVSALLMVFFVVVW